MGKTNLDELELSKGIILRSPINDPAYLLGRVFFDPQDFTLSVMVGNGVINQLGQENLVYVRNNSGSDIHDGAAVYSTGASGQRPSVALAKADYIETSRVCGVATQAIPNNSNGWIATFGIVRDIDTSSWNEEDRLYLSSTIDGELTNVPPVNGYVVPVAIVLHKAAGAGMMFVNPCPVSAFGDTDGGNYFSINAHGFARAIGLGTGFDDLQQSLVSSAAVVTPANRIVSNAANCSKTFKSNTLYPDDFMSTTLQLSHKTLPGSNVNIHIHYEQTTSDIPNFLIGTRWQVQGKPTQTVTTLNRWTETVFSYDSSPSFNQILRFSATVPPVDYGQVSDIIKLQIWRDTTNVSTLFSGADPVAGDVDVVNMDGHIEQDTPTGSDSEYSKYS